MPATAVESATVGSTATVELTAARGPETMESAAANRSATAEAFSTETFAAETFTPVEPAAAIETVPSAVVAASAIEPVEPWTGTDEHAACKVIRTVVAVRRARVGRVAVITVSADRRSGICRRYSESDSDPDLRAGRTCHGQHDAEQHCIFKISHIVASSIPVRTPCFVVPRLVATQSTYSIRRYDYCTGCAKRAPGTRAQYSFYFQSITALDGNAARAKSWLNWLESTTSADFQPVGVRGWRNQELCDMPILGSYFQMPVMGSASRSPA